MVLVLFFAFVLAFVIILVFFSYIKIVIKNLELNTENNKNNESIIIIKIILFGKILFCCKVQEKIWNKVSFNKEKFHMTKNDKKKIFNKLKKANIKLEKLDLKVAIGLEDCVITSYVVGLLSAIISNVLPYIYNKKNNVKNYNYQVMPIYNKFFSKLQLNCIISAKLVHIIFIILLIRKGSKKYERTSNRESYGYSYE